MTTLVQRGKSIVRMRFKPGLIPSATALWAAVNAAIMRSTTALAQAGVDVVSLMTPASVAWAMVSRSSSPNIGYSQIPTTHFDASVTQIQLRNGARYVRGISSADLRAVQDADGTWWKLDVASGVIDGRYLGLVLSSPTAATTNAMVINAALAALNAIGGGTLRLPSGDIYVGASIDNKYQHVMVEGVGRDSFHDAAVPAFGTRLLATANTFPVLRLRSPFASETGSFATTTRNVGSGFRNITTYGGTRGIEIVSVSFCTVDVHIQNAVGDYAAWLSCGSSYVDLNDIGDSQYNWIRITARLDDPVACANTKLAYVGGGNTANWCFNHLLSFNGEGQNDGVIIQSADNNEFIYVLYNIVTNPTNAGPYKALICRGNGANPTRDTGNGCNGNTIKVSSNGPIIVEGTETSGVTFPSGGTFLIDQGNGTPIPTVDASAERYTKITTAMGHAIYGKHTRPVCADTYVGAITASNLLTSADTQMAVNGTGGYVDAWSDGTNVIGVAWQSGILRFLQRAGSGGVEFDVFTKFATRVSGSGLPTSTAGLASGELWVDTAAGNVVKRVP